jgi:alkylhydroperoxidase family enzyme
LTEEEIAGLDGDWSEFSPKLQAAFAFARKLSYEPHLLTDADIDRLRPHFTDLQILEMTLSIAGNNSTNRWKEGAGIPQNRESSNFSRRSERPLPPDRVLPIKTYLTPTPEQFKNKISVTAPVHVDSRTKSPTRDTLVQRPPLEPRADVEKLLALCRQRKPRLPLVDEVEARKVLGEDWPAGPAPQWVRLLTNFPRDGKSRIASVQNAQEKGDLTPLLKAQVSWIVARQDRAWYAVGEAKQRLNRQGWSDDQIYTLDGDWKGFTPAERALFTVARQLAASPIMLTDDEAAEAVKLTSPRDVVQLITYVTNRALFNRITEAAGLTVDQ